MKIEYPASVAFYGIGNVRYLATAIEKLGCTCPDDCNCRKSWRPNYCGCKSH